MMKTSSSRTDSLILTLISPLENFLTVQGTRGTLSLREYEPTRIALDALGGCSPLGHSLGELGVAVACVESEQGK